MITPDRRWLIGLVFTVGFAGASPSCVADQAAQFDNPPSCGVVGLYVLFHLEGRNVALSTIANALPAASANGDSMSELRDAARSLGLTLVGRQLPSRGPRPDRPLLAFLKRGQHGHYVVVRPLGHTGKRVQVLDGPRKPMLLDFSDLCGSSEWTGLALVPNGPNWPARVAWTVAGCSLVALAARRLSPRFRRREPAMEN